MCSVFRVLLLQYFEECLDFYLVNCGNYFVVVIVLNCKQL